MAQLFSNNALTMLAAPLDRLATELQVSPGTGALFPEITNEGDYFYITVEDRIATDYREILSIIGRTGDTLIIGARALEGSLTQDMFPIGSIVELRLTASFINTQNAALNVISDQLVYLENRAFNTVEQLTLLSGIASNQLDALNNIGGQTDTQVNNSIITYGNQTNLKLNDVNANLLDIKTAIESQQLTVDGIDTLNLSVNEVNTSVGTVDVSVNAVNASVGEVKTAVDTVNTSIQTTNGKLDQALTILQNQLVELQNGTGGGGTVNTQTLEAILDTLILLSRKPTPRLDTTGRTVIDASETLVKIDTTTALATTNVQLGVQVGSTTYSNALELFDRSRINYQQIIVG